MNRPLPGVSVRNPASLVLILGSWASRPASQGDRAARGQGSESEETRAVRSTSGTSWVADCPASPLCLVVLDRIVTRSVDVIVGWGANSQLKKLYSARVYFRPIRPKSLARIERMMGISADTRRPVQRMLGAPYCRSARTLKGSTDEITPVDQ